MGAEQSACRVIRHKTISEIASELKQSGNVLADFGVEIALSAIIKAFERKGMIEENNDIELTGFFIDNKVNLIASNVSIDKPSLEGISEALKCIDEITKYYKGRLDLLSTLTKWGIVAPLGFVYKQNRSRFLN